MSQQTQLTLLEQLRGGDSLSWEQADRLYRPLIAAWLRRFGLPADDVDDLTQEVMLTLSREISSFDHRGHLGAFRGWLKTITVNRARAFLRGVRPPYVPGGGTEFHHMLQQLADSDSEISRQFDRDHDAHLVAELIRQIGCEFADVTNAAFRMHVLDGRDVSEVAEALGVNRWTVYQAKSRVLRRLRERIGAWAHDLGVE